jgi:hypothetical protein
MAHYHHRDAAEENWAEADDATATEAALYYAQMATYEATVELAEEIQNLQSMLTIGLSDVRNAIKRD